MWTRPVNPRYTAHRHIKCLFVYKGYVFNNSFFLHCWLHINTSYHSKQLVHPLLYDPVSFVRKLILFETGKKNIMRNLVSNISVAITMGQLELPKPGEVLLIV